MTYKITPISVSVHPENESPIFGESATHIKLRDEGAGLFVLIKQNNCGLDAGEIKLDPQELDLIINSAHRLLRDAQ